MTEYLVNQTKSYTLIVSKETGQMKLELSDDLKENLMEMMAEADTNADAVAGVLDLMGDDASAYLAAMGELMGQGDTLADIYAEKGTAGVTDAIAEMKGDPFAGATGFIERANTNNGFDNFEDVAGSDLSSITGYGQPSGDPFAEEGSEDGKEAIEAAISQDGLMSAEKAVVVFVLVVGGLYLVYKAYETDKKVNDGLDMPANPDEPDFNFEEWLERPWAEESLDPTFGETMPSDPDSDPNGGHHVDGHTKEFDPEAELDGLILTDPDAIQDAITAAEAQEAANFHYDTTTTPVEAEFEFKPEFGNPPAVNGGEDYDGMGDGGLMATATEYIVSEREGELSLSDTMVFNESVQSGEVFAEGTSNGLISTELNGQEQGVYIPEMM